MRLIVGRLWPAALLLLGSPAARADNWPQWRGPENDGVSRETGVPVRWGDGENIAWKLPLPGPGGSTPAVWGDHIYLTSTDGADVLLLCVSTEGRELWRRKLGTGSRPIRGDEANGASASPSADGARVYAFDGLGDLVCFDKDGAEVWRFNAQDRYGKFRMMWGMHTSPLLYGDRLYLALLHSGGAWVVALDKATGREVWKVERPSDAKAECKQSYASPSVWHAGDGAYLVVHGNDYATAHRLSDGKEIWRVGELNPKERYRGDLRFVASPVVTPELIVVPSAKNGPVVGVRPDAKGEVGPGSASEQWRLKNNTPDVPSPLVHDGLVYLCKENGLLICLDARTGRQLYAEPLHRQRYRASPVYADGKMYLTARDGVVTVVQAGRVFKRLAENRLGDQVAASPAIADGRIYLRGFDALYAIGKEGK